MVVFMVQDNPEIGWNVDARPMSGQSDLLTIAVLLPPHFYIGFHHFQGPANAPLGNYRSCRPGHGCYRQWRCSGEWTFGATSFIAQHPTAKMHYHSDYTQAIPPVFKPTCQADSTNNRLRGLVEEVTAPVEGDKVSSSHIARSENGPYQG